jgi:hypothetical protein
MATGHAGENSAEDAEVIRLAKARLIRVCRLAGAAAEQALKQAATEQRAALVSVAMRVLSATPRDLAAGRVVRVGRPAEPRRPTGPRRHKAQQKPFQRKRRRGRR